MKKAVILICFLILAGSATPVFAQRMNEVRTTATTKFPNDVIKKIDYDVRTDANPVYIGYGLKGADISEDVWTIQLLEYDGSDRLISLTVAYGAWDNRASLTYE